MKLKLLIVAGAAILASPSAFALEIVGSSTVFPFSAAVVEEVQASNPNLEISIESTGSGGGAKLFCAGEGLETPSITNASRRIKLSEVALCAENSVTNVTEYRVGFDGIVIMSGLSGADMDLSKVDIYLALNDTVPDGNGGKMPNQNQLWSDVRADLPAISIKVMGPPPSSGTRDAFEELVFESASKTLFDGDKSIVSLRTDGPYIESGENDNAIVEKLGSDPGLLGVAGFSFLDQNSDRLKGMTVDGIQPTFDAIADGEYGISRSLWFYVKNAHLGLVDGIEEYVKEWLDEDTSGEDGYLIDLGLIPLLDPEWPSLGVANGAFAE